MRPVSYTHLSAALKIAVICGTPAPATTLVVHMDPGPTPTFTQSAPRLTKSRVPSAVATLPAITIFSGHAFFITSTVSRTDVYKRQDLCCPQVRCAELETESQQDFLSNSETKGGLLTSE